jgi:alkyl hydroperoxide reductase subunit AhpF
MALFDEKIRTQLGDIFRNLKDTVNLVLFTQEFECRACGDARAFVEEIASLSDRIRLTVRDYQKEGDEAVRLGVDKIPAILINGSDNRDLGIRYYGLPAGYEINSFVGTLVEVSGRREPLKESVASRAAAIGKDAHIQVFISPT